MPPISAVDIVKRQRQVFSLFIRGYSPKQITKTLHLDRRTVNADIKASTQFDNEELVALAEKTRQRLVKEVTHLLQECWRNVDDANTAGERAQALNTVKNVSEQLRELMQSVGLMDKEPDKFEGVVTNEIDILKTNEFFREHFLGDNNKPQTTESVAVSSESPQPSNESTKKSTALSESPQTDTDSKPNKD